MTDDELVSFLRWSLPRMGRRYAGVRKVRRQIRKRLSRRMSQLGLESLAEYERLLQRNEKEWALLDYMCRITISRFYRDKKIFQTIKNSILPSLAAGKRNQSEVKCWSAGGCSGEEPYTLQILWQKCVVPRFDECPDLMITVTEIDPLLIKRAEQGFYPPGALRDFPVELFEDAFIFLDGNYQLKEEFKQNVRFFRQDIRKEMPEGQFDIILCRNLVFTYFEPAMQNEILVKLTSKMLPEGYLIIGIHESLPDRSHFLEPVDNQRVIFQIHIS